MTITERINSAFGVYRQSDSVKELTRAAEALEELISGKEYAGIINAVNRENAQFLQIKLKLKALACEFFLNGYEHSDYLLLKAYAESAEAECEKLGFAKTGELCLRVLACATDTDNITFDAVGLKECIIDGEGRCVAVSADECRAVAGALSDKCTAAQALKLPENIFESGVKFPDIKAQLVTDLRELKATAEKCRESFSEGVVSEIMRTGVQDITARLAGAGCEYYPVVEIDKLARAIVLFTPLPDEAELFARVNAEGADIYTLQALSCEDKDADAISALFEEFEKRGADCVIYGMPRFRSKTKGDFLRAVMKFGKAGRRAYIVADDGTRSVYDEALTFADGGLSPLDISFLYLSLPDFSQTVEIMQELGMLTGGADIDFVRKNMAFAGFAGFNEAVRAFRAGADWKKIVSERSQDNFDLSSKYMLRLPRQALFIDGGWGSYREDIITRKAKSFDYDDIRGVNPDNIRRIMESNFSLFLKCGMISTYCLLCGADGAAWAGFSPEVKSERLTEATKLVMRALGMSTVPQVEVLDDIEVKGAGGLCYDGGKRIVYKNSCISDFDWTAKAVCHESFHAFQRFAITEGWQDWYETELHVTAGRIDQWNYNFGKYRPINKDKDGYMIQIVESDARAFENDCLGKDASMGQILTLIDLA